MDKTQLKEIIRKANIKYRIGETINIANLPLDIQKFLNKKDGELSDTDYDLLLKELNIDDSIIEEWDDYINENITHNKKEKLKYPMYSLNKNKSMKEVVRWFKNRNISPNTDIILTPKYDGVSILKNEYNGESHSRGDGVNGQNITNHINKYSKKTKSITNFYTIGELLISKKNFKENKFIKDNGDLYKNPRNTVAGLVNSDNISEYWKFIDHIRYGIADDNYNYDKLEQLKLIENKLNFKTPYIIIPISELSPILFDELYYKWNEEYEIDGIVVDINNKNIRKELGRESNNNPRYSFAYKTDWSKPIQSTVKYIEWDVSKNGNIKPVVIIDPLKIDGVTIKRVTGYNAKFILDNGIGKDTTINIIRSGSVIPKIVNVIQCTKPDFIGNCPSCNSVLTWNKNFVELQCENQHCETKNIKKISFFFSSLGISDFGESIVSKFYKNGFNTINKIINMNTNDISNIDGMGVKSSIKILKQFNNIKNSTYDNLAHASGCFENLGSRKVKMIIDGLGGMGNFRIFEKNYINSNNKKKYLDILNHIHGVSDITSSSFLNGIIKFNNFLDELNITINEKQIKKSNISFKDKVFVFSGIRDNELKKFIIDNDGEVKNSVSKNTTDLVVKDKNMSTSKINKAKELYVNIIQIDELKKLINNKK